MAGRRISDGKSHKVTVPVSTTVIAGNFYDFDGVLGMAFEDVTTGAGATGLVAVEVDTAEYETNQIDTAQAFALNARIYWDATLNRFTDQSAGMIEVGYVTIAKDAGNAVSFRRTVLNKVA